jgi:hypothetical protein
MALPTQKVELGFDLSFSASSNLFTLNDATKGQLDGEFGLGGLQFIDVTERVKNFSIARGRRNDFAAFPAGQAVVEFNNHDRAFDPLYAESPFAGNILPRRQIRISSGGIVQFVGWVNDWNLDYLVNGDSIVSAVAVDATSIFAKQTINDFTPVEQFSGARINSILNLSGVEWNPEFRDIDAGQQLLGNQPVEDNTNVLQYLQTVAQSEPGSLFIDKQGKVTFRDRTNFPTSDTTTFLGGTGIPFQNIAVVYGSENLYNEIQVSRLGGGTAVAFDPSSQADYGVKNLTISDLLMATDDQALELALVYAQRYSQPEYHFDSVEINVMKLSPAQQEEILTLDLGAIARIEFTPNGIGEPIVRFTEIIGINKTVGPQTHFVTLGFQALDFTALILDDEVFGRLDSGVLSY